MSYNPTSCPVHEVFFAASACNRLKSVETPWDYERQEISFGDRPQLTLISCKSLPASSNH
jgi:hypothetical protein